MRRLLLVLILMSAACQAQSAPTATPSPTATDIPSATSTPTVTLSPTPQPTATATATASATLTPTVSPTPSITPTASITPAPAISFLFDQWNVAEIPDSISSGIGAPMIAFINQNDRDGVGDVRTPQPATNRQTLYYGSATNPGVRSPILEMDASTGDLVYVAPPGNAVAYFVNAPVVGGLYVLDVTVGLSGRVVPIDSLLQRGFFSEPTWSPDGSELAIALSTGYAMDIFVVARDGSITRNLTDSGAYDLWPAWSPDGRHLLFVSDRAQCPTWTPGEANACDALTDPPPSGGNPYVLEISTGELTQLSEQWLTEAPYWINSRLVGFASGDLALGDMERLLYTVDIVTGLQSEVRLLSGGPQVSLAEAWAPDGSAVVYQDASGASNPVILMDELGNQIGRQGEDLNFPRFGMSAAWSPDSTRIAIGGIGGNCPFGSRVLDLTFSFIARGGPPPSMCDPVFSPDGTLLAFTGVNPRVDGRVDVYVANNNGFGAVNLTGDLRGQIHLVGWVG